jgi:hypothetical protein
MFTPTWEKPLEFGAGPRDGVLATSLSLLVDSKAKPEDLEALAGVLTVHFPTALETVRLDDLTVGSTARHGDSAITVMERGHRRLTLALDRAGDAIAYIRLLDAQGQAIAYSGRQTTGDGGERFELMPMSPYERAEVVIATARDTKAYPFVLTLQPRKD